MRDKRGERMTKKKIAALVPMRHESERVPGKNFRPFCGLPLYHHIVSTLLACPLISTVAIDTDSDTIRKDAESNFPNVLLIDRPAALCGGEVPMNDILLHDVTCVEADFYLQTHSTNPLLKPATVTRAITEFLEKLPNCDSLFSVTRTQKRFWDEKGRAVNHDPAVLLRTQDLPPVYEENSNIYIFTRRGIESTRRRIGEKPLMFQMDRPEAWDIDEELDFLVAEFLFKQREKEEGGG